MTFSAAEKAGDNAETLVTAYSVASRAGWEGDSEVGKWLYKAANLSGEYGPLQKISLKDFLDRKPDWDRRESDILKLLSRGEIPMFLAAQSLNKSLIDLTLFPALANLSESDPRRRGIIPAYSGRHLPRTLNISGMTVGMDAIALLTLSFLNLLEKALDAFDTVYVPHLTLAWLFEEKQRAAFHQPSRIRDAHQIRDLLARDILEKFVPSTLVDNELAVQVGNNLALLISEAEQIRDHDNTQRIVVRPFPVYRPSSLMGEEADLSGHTGVMSSCLSVVEKLHEKGQITTEEEKKARAYLQIQERPWPNQPEIRDGAVLYLDDLAISYFLHLGILEKLRSAGLKAIASPTEVSEANALINYEGICGKVNETIEYIRHAISTRIESQKIKVGRRHNADDPKEQSTYEHPTIDVMALAPYCNAIILDDRFLNKHAHIGDGKVQVPIFSTFDLLNALNTSGKISSEDLLEKRTLLRRAGYLFMPIIEDELKQHLNSSTVRNDHVVEIAELKAIRESILRVRMGDWLQLPKEGPWLDTTLNVFIRVLKKLWTHGAELSKIIAQSNWILDQLDVRGWCHSFIPENKDYVVRTGRGPLILLLLSPPLDVTPEIKKAYWSWVEDRILAPIQEQFPDLYAWIVEWHIKQFSEMTEMKLTTGGTMNNTPYGRDVMAEVMLKLTPPLIRETLFKNPKFKEDYGFKIDAVISLDDTDLSIQRSMLFDTIRKILSGTSELEVTDVEGRAWKIRNECETNELPKLVISSDERQFVLPDFAVLSHDSTIRLRSFDEAAVDVNLPAVAQDTWRKVLLERPLEDDEIEAFTSDFRDTPVHIGLSIYNEIQAGQSSVKSLVPSSRKYYDRLVGAYDGSKSIEDYATGAGRQLFFQLAAWRPYEGFLLSLFLSSHSALTTEIGTDHLSSEDLVRAFQFLVKRGDSMSQLGAIEVGLRILPERPEIEPFIICLIEKIRDDDVDGPVVKGLKLFSALFVLVDGELSRTRLMAAEPPFYRRLASLAQAALIYRQLVCYGVDETFYAWAIKNRVEQFYMQSLVDMRLEPRWNPYLASAAQMKADFFGRIMSIATNYDTNIKASEIHNLIFSAEARSLESLSEFPRPYFPGPLEGAEDSPFVLPTDFYDTIEKQLNADGVGPSSIVDPLVKTKINRI